MTTKLTKDMAMVATLVQKLYNKHSDYLSFSYACGKERGIPYERWNIYTFVIGHNTFGSARELIEFMDRLLIDGDDLYLNHRKNELTEEELSLRERLQGVQEEIERLNMDEVEIKEKDKQWQK